MKTLVKRLAIGATVIFVVMVALAYVNQPEPMVSMKETAAKVDLRSLTPEEFDTKIAAAKGSPAILFIYASWCPYCRETWKDIQTLSEAGRLDGIKPLFFSIERNPSALRKYLDANGYDKHIRTDLLEQTDPQKLYMSIRKLDSNFTGGVPYLAFLNEDGKIVAELGGKQDKATLENALAEIRKPKP